jgi:O-antigen/teichoic acid export membrane protein
MSVRASLAYFVTRGASGALAVVTVSLFARLLGPAAYAHWALAVTVSAFIAGVLIQPLNASLARFLPRPGFETLPATLGRAMLIAALPALPLAALLEWIAPVWLPAGIAFAALLLGLTQGFFDFSAQFLSSTLQARRYGRLYILKSVLALGLGVAALKLGYGVWGVVGAMVASYLAACAISAPDAWKSVWRGRFSRRELAAVRDYALPTGVALATGFLLQWSDRLILAAHVPAAELGAYSAAGDLALQGMGLLFSAFHLAWFPRLIAAWERSRDEVGPMFARYLQLTAAVMLPAALGFVLVAPDLSQALLGGAFRSDAASVMPWFALAALLAGLRCYVIDVQLNLTQRMKTLGLIVGASALLSVALNLWAAPRYGILGAARVAALVQGVGCLMSFAAGRGVLKLGLPLRDVLALTLALAAMAAALALLPEGGWRALVLRVAVGALVYAGVALIANLAGVRSLVLNRLRKGGA